MGRNKFLHIKKYNQANNVFEVNLKQKTKKNRN